jgi:hypothetical protein
MRLRGYEDETKTKIQSLFAIGIAILMFRAMRSMIFESVVDRLNNGWTFLTRYFCEIFATIGGMAIFVFAYIQVMKKYHRFISDVQPYATKGIHTFAGQT